MVGYYLSRKGDHLVQALTDVVRLANTGIEVETNSEDIQHQGLRYLPRRVRKDRTSARR